MESHFSNRDVLWGKHPSDVISYGIRHPIWGEKMAVMQQCFRHCFPDQNCKSSKTKGEGTCKHVNVIPGIWTCRESKAATFDTRCTGQHRRSFCLFLNYTQITRFQIWEWMVYIKRQYLHFTVHLYMTRFLQALYQNAPNHCMYKVSDSHAGSV